MAKGFSVFFFYPETQRNEMRFFVSCLLGQADLITALSIDNLYTMIGINLYVKLKISKINNFLETCSHSQISNNFFFDL